MSGPNFGCADFAVKLSVNDGTVAMIDAIVRWCACTNGNANLSDGLRGLADAIDCDLISVTRIRKDRRQSGKPVVVSDRLQHQLPRDTVRSFAPAVLGGYLFANRPGTAWLASMMDTESDPSLRAFQSEYGLRELLVIPLDVDSTSIDVLDIHFSRKLDPDLFGLLTMTAPALSQTWKTRCKGMFTEHVLENTYTHDDIFDDPILSAQNPAQLTRAEYRLCSLVSMGLNVSAIAESMHVSISTVRSHLRSIYTKTSCRSLSELTFALMRDKVAPTKAATTKDASQRLVG